MFASGRVKVIENYHFKLEPDRMEKFQKDMVNFATLKGFRRFQSYVRATDEILIKLFKLEKLDEIRPTLSSLHLVEDIEKKYLSQDTLDKLEQLKIQEGDSNTIQQFHKTMPSYLGEEEVIEDASCSTLLVGAYLRRHYPMVWPLSDVHDLCQDPIPLNQPVDLDTTFPLILESINAWFQKEVDFFDVVVEVLSTGCEVVVIEEKSDINPFQLDFRCLQTLPLEELIFTIPSLITFLTNVVLKEPPFTDSILQDIEGLHLLHLDSYLLLDTPTSPSIQHVVSL